jgi:Protein of unknown function (DUF5131)
MTNIDHLRRVPARVRFLSIEPLLEDLGDIDLTGIHLVIVGGESGADARPMHPGWARSIRDQCATAGVPFFFKQIGEWAWPDDQITDAPSWRKSFRPDQVHIFPDGLNVGRIGKNNAGRLLDGIEHNAMPEVS